MVSQSFRHTVESASMADMQDLSSFLGGAPEGATVVFAPAALGDAGIGEAFEIIDTIATGAERLGGKFPIVCVEEMTAEAV